MSSSNSPRQLNINCTISAVFLPEHGSFLAYHSRYKQQSDPANTLSATFYEELERNKFTPKLSTISTGAGGLIPSLNLFIGAPAATFSEGAIGPGLEHPSLNLLKGAIESKAFPGVFYTADTKNKITPKQNQTAAPAGLGISTAFSFSSFPYIPLSKIGQFSELNSIQTYNIWTQKFVSQDKLKYLINFGVTNYTNLGGAQLNTTTSPNGSKVTVHSQNKNTVIRRIFPIADDLVYENPYLYYPPVNGVTKNPDQIKAQRGPNCGFWLHLDITPPSRDKSTSSPSGTSEVIIYWGYPNENEAERRITEFVLILNPGSKPSLRYKSPGDQTNNSLKNILNKWNKIDLKTDSIFQFGRPYSLDVFVHYAGTNMYIGFTPEISQWNVIEPIKVSQLTKESSDDSKYVPYQPKKSFIEIYLKNCALTFTYSPICFNNFNSELLTSTNNDTRNKILIEASVPKKDYDNGSLSPENIIKTFIDSRRPKNELLTAGTGSTNISSPTYYGDWRRAKETEEEYALSPELKYEELSHEIDDSIDDNIKVLIKSQITYETTIEGPVFYYLRSFPEAPQRSKIIKDIWGKYADVSSYVTSATVTNDYGSLPNRSYKKARATITFANLTNDLIGIQILNALQENVLVFTLKSGYGNDLNTFFQGISRSVRVNRTPDGFTINVFCEDLGDVLLSDIRFNTTSSQSFNLRNFQGILEDCFYFAGLKEVYSVRNPYDTTTEYDALYGKYLKSYIGANGLAEPNSLAAKVITVNKKTRIGEVVKILLSLMNYAPGDKAKNIMDGLPILYWDATKHKFVLTLRKDQPKDILFFAGDTSNPEAKIYLANNNPDREHGIVDNSGWEETTSLNSLHSKVIFQTRLSNLKFFYRESTSESVNKVLGTTGYDNLKKFVQNPANTDDMTNFQNPAVLGYIGYNRELVDINDIGEVFYQDETLANEFFSIKDKYIRGTYTTLSLNVLVTKPLNDTGFFSIKSFSGGTDNETETFNYSQVTYIFDVDQNLIKAAITAERYPDLIGE